MSGSMNSRLRKAEQSFSHTADMESYVQANERYIIGEDNGESLAILPEPHVHTAVAAYIIALDRVRKKSLVLRKDMQESLIKSLGSKCLTSDGRMHE